MARKPKHALPPPSSSTSSSPGDDEKKKRGPGNQPFDLDMEVIDKIFDLFAHTSQPLRAILEELRARDMCCPSLSKFYYLVNRNVEGIGERYVRARKVRADAMLEDALEIADDRSKDIIVDEDGKLKADHDIVRRAELKVKTRLQIAEKLNPAAYSSRPQGKSGDGSADGQDLATLSDDDLSSALESAAADLGVVLVQAEPAAQLEDLRRLAGALGFDLVARKV